MGFNKRSFIILAVCLLTVSVFIVSVLCAAKVISPIAIVIILLCIIAIAALLNCIKKSNQKESSDELLARLKECFSEIEVLSDKIVEKLEYRQSILDDLKKEIQQCDNDDALNIFLEFHGFHEEANKLWKKYIEYVKKESIITQVKDGNGHAVDEFHAWIGKIRTEILTSIDVLADEFLIKRENFNAVITSLQEERSAVRELYKAYIKNEESLKKYNNQFEKVHGSCKTCVEKMLNCIQREKEESIPTNILTGPVRQRSCCSSLPVS